MRALSSLAPVNFGGAVQSRTFGATSDDPVGTIEATVTLENLKSSHRIRDATSGCAAFSAANKKKVLIRWPDRRFGPRPGLKEVTLVCRCLFASCLVVPLSVALWFHWKAGSLGDFVYFYGIGHLANEHSASTHYDYASQLKIFNVTRPLAGGRGDHPHIRHLRPSSLVRSRKFPSDWLTFCGLGSPWHFY